MTLKGNPKRRAKLLAKQFTGPIPGYDHGQAVRNLPCCVSGAAPPSDPHHVKSRAAGGTWEDLVPLSHEMHQLLHTLGRWSFEQRYGVHLEAVAERLAGEARE